MNRLSKLLIISFLLLNVCQLQAVPAYPYPIKIQQPDGSYITIMNKGDEFFHYQTTEDGFPILKNKKGVYNYAKVDVSGKFIDTEVKANDFNKRSTEEAKYIKAFQNETIIQQINKQKRIQRIASSDTSNPQKFPISGSPRSLVILINFSDLQFVTSNPKVAFTNLLNQNGYSTNNGTGSAKDYFSDNSMGAFVPQFDVVGPFNLTKTYSNYGQNNADGDDMDPVQMVVDACTVAAQNGVDFSTYDTDNNGYVDNVFVYYAGYNEAEHGPDNTVWPHRWAIYPGNNYSGTTASITFNGKKIRDYACTSELKGSAGANMCGIGTFCHEFGHVLGLVDFYATNGASHQTLSYWDIMDAGPYLNGGKTPPSYSAHERFYLGWLTPTELKTPYDATLEPLNTSNKAYIITENGNSNLIGSSPNPVEYYLLENRQKTGWDAYLPGHGMLISHVYYNTVTWDKNTPNNDPNAMGVDIVEADNIGSNQSLSGDPFPGVGNVTNYTPILRSGVLLSSKPITFIKEKDNNIYFRFKGGINAPSITTSSNLSQFNTIKGTPSASQTMTVSGKKLIDNIKLTFTNNTHFEIKRESDPESFWGKTLTLTQVDSIVPSTNIMVRYNPTIPSYLFTHNDIINFSSTDAEVIKVSLVGKSSRPVYVKPPVALNAKDVTFKSFVAQWKDTTNDATGYYFSAYSIENGEKIFVKDIEGNYMDSVWTTSTADTLYNLVSDKDYYYVVRESDRNLSFGYENITEKSNQIKLHTLPYTSEKILRVQVDKSNNNLFVYPPTIGDVINIYNTMGQKVMSLVADGDIINLSFLPKNQIYIIQSDKLKTKVIW